MSARNFVTSGCSLCNSVDLKQIVDFGHVALAGAFLKPEDFNSEKKYPLRLNFCRTCFGVQVADHAPPEELFHANYFYFSSSIGTLREHFESYAKEIASRFLAAPGAAALEFGCNDGVLLRPLADQGIATLIGVDPATNVVGRIRDARINVVNDFFTEEVAGQIVAAYGKLDVVMANNVYAHISNIQGATRAIKSVLKEDGVFIFEVHYLGKVIEELQYDMVYHEHLYYHSLLSVTKHLERFDMMVFDVKPIPIHAGSMRFYACNKNSRHSSMVSENVPAMEIDERSKGYHQAETFDRFALRVANHRRELVSVLENLRSQGSKIAGYGASGRANAMIQYCALSHKHLDFMIDDAPAKTGFFTPGSHFEIVPGSVLTENDPPDYILVFAWSFLNEIRKRAQSYLAAGGKMIIPLPKVHVARDEEYR